MNAILSLFGLNATAMKGTITMVILIVLVLGGAGLYFWVKHEHSVLNEQLIAERAKTVQLTSDNAVIKKVNEDNALTIANLQNDQALSAQSLANLSVTMAKDRKTLSELAISIGKLPPGSNGPLAPVLKQTIQGIQDIRAKRLAEGAQK